MPSSAKIMLLSALLGGVALSGCSWVKEWPPKDAPASSQSSEPIVPQTKLMQTPDATWLVPADPAEPPVEHMVPKNGQSADALNRINELEEEVAGLRNEMSMMLPAMTKLAETQSALRNAVASHTPDEAALIAPAAGGPAQYEPVPLYNPGNAPSDMNAAYMPTPAPQQAAPMPQAVAAPTAITPPVAMAAVSVPASAPPSGPPIGDIRFGDNNGKTRMVLDASFPPEYTYNLEAGVLTVRLPQSGWGPAAAAAVSAPLVESYNAAPDGAGGTLLSVRLRGPAKVDMAQSLPPGAGKGHRIVIDIAPL